MKTPQKFPRCEKCGTTLEPSELVNGYFCPNEKCDRGAIAEEKPSLHPTDDVQKVLDKFAQSVGYKDWGQLVHVTERPEDTLEELKELASLGIEAGQKSGEEKIKSLSESLRVDRLRLEWADKRIKSLEAELKKVRK